MYKYLIFCALFLFNYSILSQEKEQLLEEVKVNNWIKKTNNINTFYSLNKEKIQLGSFNDLGDAISSLPGVNIKDYGGVGGLKTVSSRGINGTHIGIYVDEFSQSINSIGEMDLSKIQVNQMNEIKFIHAGQDNLIHQVSSYFNAQNIFLYSLNNNFDNNKFKLIIHNKISSFSQRDFNILLKYNSKRFLISNYYQYRYAKGDFPYKFYNYDELIYKVRNHNEIKEHFGGINLSYKFKNKSTLTYNLNLNKINRELPSAVILYSNEKGQYLNTNLLNNQFSYIYNLNKNWSHNLYLQYQINNINYIDSTFLNKENVLQNKYYLRQFISGFHSKVKIKKTNLSLGIEYDDNSLIKDSLLNRRILRAFINFQVLLRNWNIDLFSGLMNVSNNKSNFQQNGYIFVPGIQISSKKSFSVIGEVLINAKRTSRLPSFAEMYFQNIANTNLLPEIANQISINSNNLFYVFNKKVNFNNSFYFSSIENKIVSIPSKNLFTWTIKNYDKVFSCGTEHAINIEFYKTNSSLITLNSLYSFSKSVNNNKNSKLYGHQLPYIPNHNIQNSLFYNYKNFSTQFRMIYISSRYALPENIISNIVEEYYSFDLLFAYEFKFKFNKIKSQFTVFNLFNSSYQYIRYYPLPGRHFSIQLIYEIY